MRVNMYHIGIKDGFSEIKGFHCFVGFLVGFAYHNDIVTHALPQPKLDKYGELEMASLWHGS